MATYTNFSEIKRGGGGVSPAPALCTRLRGVAYERPDERGRLRRRAAGGGDIGRELIFRNAHNTAEAGQFRFGGSQLSCADINHSDSRRGLISEHIERRTDAEYHRRRLSNGRTPEIHRLCLTEASA